MTALLKDSVLQIECDVFTGNTVSAVHVDGHFCADAIFCDLPVNTGK